MLFRARAVCVFWVWISSGFRMEIMQPLVIAGRAFQSRLIVGTGKYKDGPETQAAIEASGAEMVTVAVRRVNLDRSSESLLDFIDPRRYFLLPNTAGCYTAEEALGSRIVGAHPFQPASYVLLNAAGP